jgi:hypothetical protein
MVVFAVLGKMPQQVEPVMCGIFDTESRARAAIAWFLSREEPTAEFEILPIFATDEGDQ